MTRSSITTNSEEELEYKRAAKGQITIPSEIRSEFDIKLGEIVYFITGDWKLILRKGPLELS